MIVRLYSMRFIDGNTEFAGWYTIKMIHVRENSLSIRSNYSWLTNSVPIRGLYHLNKVWKFSQQLLYTKKVFSFRLLCNSKIMWKFYLALFRYLGSCIKDRLLLLRDDFSYVDESIQGECKITTLSSEKVPDAAATCVLLKSWHRCHSIKF